MIAQNIWHFLLSRNPILMYGGNDSFCPIWEFLTCSTVTFMSAEPWIKKSWKRSSSRVKFEHIRNDYFNAYQFYALCYEIQVQINFWWRLMVSRSYKITSIFYSRLSADPPSSKPVQISFLTIMWPISHDLFRITWWCPA